jgi:hypothetical protein
MLIEPKRLLQATSLNQPENRLLYVTHGFSLDDTKFMLAVEARRRR